MRQALYLMLLLITSTYCKSQSTLYFTGRETSRVAINAAYSYQCAAFDSAGKTLTYTAETLPAWLSFNAATHTLTGKAPGKPGQYPVALAVTNGVKKAYQRFMLTVYNKQTANIACIGNSITNGTSTFNSYRRALWQMLHRAGYNVDMIGSWSKHHGGGEVPNPDFDMDHDGHSGWTAEQVLHPPDWDSIRGNLTQWLTDYTPGITLIELGTNDVFQCRKTEDVITNLSQIVGLLRKANNHVKMAVAQIPPLGQQWAPKKLCGDSVTYDERIHELNNAMLQFAKQQSTTASPVIVVDQYTGVNPATDMYDDIHPNTKGEEEMARRWFEAIKGWMKKL